MKSCESRKERRVEVKSVSIITTTVKGMIDYYQTKEHPITKKMVLEAFWLVKSNRGAPGVDGQSIAHYEEELKANT
jgi:hypothetical protein